jgi:hypothetical protein
MEVMTLGNFHTPTPESPGNEEEVQDNAGTNCPQEYTATK